MHQPTSLCMLLPKTKTTDLKMRFLMINGKALIYANLNNN